MSEQARLESALAIVRDRIDAVHAGQGADEHGTITPDSDEAHEAVALMFLAGIPESRAVLGYLATEARRLAGKIDAGVDPESAAFGLLQIVCLVGSLMGNERP